MDLQQIFEQASKLKSVQLAKIRKEYESSPGFIKATAVYASRNNEWKDLSVKEKLEKCEAFKQKGNQLFNKKDYVNALSNYSQGISLFRHFEKKDERGEHLELKDYVMEGYAKSTAFWNEQCNFDEAKSLVIALLTNCSTVSLAMKQHLDVIWCGQEILKYDEKNIKALYRMCQSHELLDTTFDLQYALKYIKRAKMIDPKNKAIVKKYRQIKNLLKEQNKKDKKQFGGMFDRGSLYEDKQAEAGNPGTSTKAKPRCCDIIAAYSNCVIK